MQRLQDISISRKLVLLVLTTTGAALVLACAGLVAHEVLTFRTELRRNLASQAQLVASSSTAGLKFEDPEMLSEIMGALSKDPRLISFCFYSRTGKPLSYFVRPNLLEQEPAPPVEKEGYRFTPGRVVVFHEAHSSDGLLGTVMLQSDLSALNARVRNYATIVATVLLICLGLAFLLSNRLQRLISRPLIELARVANEVASRRDFTIRAVKHSDDEIGHLVDRFNDMLAQIQERDAALQAAQDSLEQRVTARTTELTAANAALQHQIQERARIEEGLRQSEERFALAFQASPLAIAICTIAEGRLLDVNESFLKLLGGNREDLLGRTADELKLWVKDGEGLALFREVAERDSIQDRECRFRARNGALRHTLTSFARIDLGSKPCVLMIINDMTARIGLEAQLRHAQKMDAVGQLAAGVAHDYNNIMTVIQGHATLLLEMYGTGKDPMLGECLKEVSTAADRAVGLTRQLLAFSRKQVMQPRQLDLNEVVTNLVRMLGRLLGEHITLQLRLAPGLPSVRADVGMLEQVLTNLSVNARDAMAGGGDLTLATAVVDLDEAAVSTRPQARPGRFLCLRVKDTGCGMDSTTLARLFEPFFTTKDVGRGTGLGLATAYGIVQQHRGWIEVVSQPKLGSEFSIFLPASEEIAAEPREETSPAPVRGGHETILVVEDEASLRSLVRTILQRHGYRILEAASGPEALQVWDQNERDIALVLTDLVMPGGLTGRELADRLRTQRPGLKVIYTSGYSVDVAGKDLALQEDFHFLPKPYHPPTLVRMVRSRLESLN